MKNHHPFILDRPPLDAVNSARIHPRNGRVSVFAIEQEIRLQPHEGFTGARRLKVVRIEQVAIPSGQFAFPRPQPAGRYLTSPNLKPRLRRELPQPRLEAQEFECLVEGKSVRLRAVDEVVQDETGSFYEAQGRQLRPLAEIVMDEVGRVFEICSSGESQSTEVAQEPSNGRAIAAARDELSNRNDEKKITAKPSPQPRSNGHDDTVPLQAKKFQSEKPPAYQKIFADPGIRLKLPFARIKREIVPQLQHPEKLNDGDLVECYAQFYEAQRPLPVAHIAASELGDSAAQNRLYPLTRGRAQNLGTLQLFKPTLYSFETQTPNRQLYPGQRVYRLWPVFDPTTEQEKNLSRPSVAPQKAAAVLRSEIPPEYMNPLQFKYSREEVLYDMKTTLGTLPPECGALARWLFIHPLRLLKTVIMMIAGRGHMKKWRAMLTGKNLDEQLWAVTPPAGFACHPTVRHWAGETLLDAGYDSERMVLEWEVFWRRRGWR